MTNYSKLFRAWMLLTDKKNPNIQLTVHNSKKLWNKDEVVVNLKIKGWDISGKQLFLNKKDIECFWNQVKFLTSQRPLLEGW